MTKISEEPQDSKGQTAKRRKGFWWQVESRVDGQRTIETFWLPEMAETRAEAIRSAGGKCRIRKCKTDIYVFDPNGGKFVQVTSEMTIKEATNWAYEWQQADRERGVVLWPCGVEFPASLAMVVDGGLAS